MKRRIKLWTSLSFCGLFKVYDKENKEYRFRAMYKGEADSLREFVPVEDDEMLGIRLWDFCDKKYIC